MTGTRTAELAPAQLRGDLPVLHLVICGSVDDGKSTLVGRLLYEAGKLYEDQLDALRRDSQRHGTQGEDLDFALLMDGLLAEREQSITIDVAYRFFSTERCNYIVADTPGHEQYTRNMVTGASTADAAVILVDARKGMLPQTRRHAFIVALMGVRHMIVAVNKMDLVEYAEPRFLAIRKDFESFAQAALNATSFTVIPVSALKADNLVEPSPHTGWYKGPAVFDVLQRISTDREAVDRAPFRLPVQWVNRPDQDFRGFCGTIASGAIRPGDRIRVAPTGHLSTVARIVSRNGDLPKAVAGQAVNITLRDEIDVSRGDVIAGADAPLGIADQFEATLIWMGDEPMFGGRAYLMKIGTASALATPAAPKYKIELNTLEHVAARRLLTNDIGVCNISVDRPLAYEPYRQNRDLGGFILIDRISNQTVAAGLIHFELRRAHNIRTQILDVDRDMRANLMAQTPCVIWFTGLSGAGKSTIANRLEVRLFQSGRHTYVLDGDNVRRGLNRDLGFTDADRVENVRRVGEVARLMMDAGLMVLVSMISPYRAERQAARELVMSGRFVEIFVDTPLSVAEERDPKGLYRKAREGRLKNFTGIDAPYEPPQNPDLRIDTMKMDPEQAVDNIMEYLLAKGLLGVSADR